VILIIEGTDLVGKSTIAEQCAASHSWPIAKIRWSLIGDAEAETRGMATATIELLAAVQPDVIFDRIYFSMWAYGKDVSYMPELIAAFDRVSQVMPARLVLLTASDEALHERYERQPDLYHSLDIIQSANARFPSLLPLLPDTLPRLHIDTTNISPGQTIAMVERFIQV
jgi:thymidylate kinase